MARCGTQKLVRSSYDFSDVKVHDPSLRGKAWASMRQLNASTLAMRGLHTVANLLDAQAAGDPLYLHDEGIESLCPSLLGKIRAPRYFPVDYLRQMGPRFSTPCEGRPSHPSPTLRAFASHPQ